MCSGIVVLPRSKLWRSTCYSIAGEYLVILKYTFFEFTDIRTPLFLHPVRSCASAGHHCWLFFLFVVVGNQTKLISLLVVHVGYCSTGLVVRSQVCTCTVLVLHMQPGNFSHLVGDQATRKLCTSCLMFAMKWSSIHKFCLVLVLNIVSVCVCVFFSLFWPHSHYSTTHIPQPKLQSKLELAAGGGCQKYVFHKARLRLPIFFFDRSKVSNPRHSSVSPLFFAWLKTSALPVFILFGWEYVWSFLCDGLRICSMCVFTVLFFSGICVILIFALFRGSLYFHVMLVWASAEVSCDYYDKVEHINL